MTTEKAMEERAFEAFKILFPSVNPKRNTLEVYFFKEGYLAASKAEQQKEISDEKLRKVIGCFGLRFLQSEKEVVAKIRKILEEPKHACPTCRSHGHCDYERVRSRERTKREPCFGWIQKKEEKKP